MRTMQKKHYQVNLKQNKWVVVFIILIFIIGSMLGIVIGWVQALNWGINKAVYFLELKGIEIDIDSVEIAQAINSYKSQIDSAYPQIENASLYGNKGN